MRILVFAKRNFKELVRDPVGIATGIGSPVGLIALLSFIMRKTGGEVAIFQIQQLAPSMIIFGLSFLSLFLGTLMSSDKNTSYLMRLLSSPMQGRDFIFGYSIPILPLGAIQTIACILVAAGFGLSINHTTVLLGLVLLPAIILYIGFGLLLGSLFSNSGLVSGFGTIIMGASIFLSGGMLPLQFIGGGFEKICYFLPFAHINDAVKNTISGSNNTLYLHLLWVLGYSIALFALSTIVFTKKAKQ